MKLSNAFALLCYLPLCSVAQSIEGDWNASLKVPGVEIPLIFHITRDGDNWATTLDSPTQGAKGIPVAATSFKDSILNLNLPIINATYLGKWASGYISGDFIQNGQKFTLKLNRGAAIRLDRPQEPVKPYPYQSEEVTFQNVQANLNLAGTFTAPSVTGRFPTVILITGSGPQNRDEELAGHKPFLVLSDHLTRQGVAVLRFDDRGIGESTGHFDSATSLDFATDVQAAVAYLKSRKDVDVSRIGLIGHSEGGLIAPIVASNSKDISYMVLLAGPGQTGEQILIAQSSLNANTDVGPENNNINRRIYQAIKETSDIPAMKIKLETIIREAIQLLPESQKPPADQLEEFVNAKVNSVATPWFRYFLLHDPANVLVNVKCPVLALNGSNDLQVPAIENLEAIRKALEKGGNKDITIKSLPGLNHLFQESTTGAPGEYSIIAQTFSPIALNEISEWVISRTK